MKNINEVFDEIVDEFKMFPFLVNITTGVIDKDILDEHDNKILKIISNYPKVVTIQDAEGRNLGMYCAIHQLEKSVLKILDNMTASLQQDRNGQNIGMYCANFKLQNATLKAYQNKYAKSQRDKNKKSIEDYATENNIELYKTKKFDLEKKEKKNNSVIDDLHKEILGL